jgi:hypothetical protein
VKILCDEGRAACRVVAWSMAEARGAELTALRRAGPGSLLRHADEQTVVAVAAIQRTLLSPNLAGLDFGGWGVIAGPCWPGATGAATAMRQFTREGHRTASPHVIPHYSLHSPAATISLAFRCHGPAFGVSGGPGHVEETLLVAVAAMFAEELPGLWIVLSDGDPTGSESRGRAIALALRPASLVQGGWRLGYDAAPAAATPPRATMNGLLAYLGGQPGMVSWHCRLAYGILCLDKED